MDKFCDDVVVDNNFGGSPRIRDADEGFDEGLLARDGVERDDRMTAPCVLLIVPFVLANSEEFGPLLLRDIEIDSCWALRLFITGVTSIGKLLVLFDDIDRSTSAGVNFDREESRLNASSVSFACSSLASASPSLSTASSLLKGSLWPISNDALLLVEFARAGAWMCVFALMNCACEFCSCGTNGFLFWGFCT